MKVIKKNDDLVIQKNNLQKRIIKTSDLQKNPKFNQRKSQEKSKGKRFDKYV